MAFLCPVRMPRRKRKKKDEENSAKNASPKGRITGSNSIDSLVEISKKEDDSDDDYEPRKVVVLHDFIPCVEDEIAVKRGEHVKALYQENDWVYVVKGDGKEGFVPFTYCVSVEEYDKRKDKIKAASQQTKNSPLNITLQDLPPAQFSKQSHGEFVVKFDFNAIDVDDISVRKGEIVEVLNKDDQDWLWVRRKSGREGFIPKDFVTKIEQISSSKSLANNGLQSTSTPNMATGNYKTAVPSSHRLHPTALSKEDIPSYFENNNNIIQPTKKHSPKYNNPRETSIPSSWHTPVIYAHPFSSVSGLDSTTEKSSTNVKVIPLSSTMSYSPNRTISSQQSSPRTPVLVANPFSSMSEIDSALPESFSKVTPMSSTMKRTHPYDSLIHHSSTKVISASDTSLPMSGVEKMSSSNARGRISLLAQMNSQQTSQLANNATSKYVNIRKEQAIFSPAVQEARLLPVNSLTRTVHPPRKNSNDLLINGQELVCTDTYVAQKRDELTVYKGDWVYADMKSRDYRGWIWAFSPSTNNQGFVPKYCLRPPATTPL